MENKKIKLVVGSSAAAVAVLGLGAFALFTDNATGGATSKAGTVKVELGEVELENAGNINPGDNDEDIPDTYIPDPDDPLYKDEDGDGVGDPVEIKTTPHDLTFEVSNTGTKSIRTRQTLIVTCKQVVENEDGEPTEVVLDPSYLSLLIEEGVEIGSDLGLGKKTYILSDGSEVDANEWDGIIVPEEPEDNTSETPEVPEDSSSETPEVPEDNSSETPEEGADIPTPQNEDEPADEPVEEPEEELYVVAIKYQLTPDIFDGVGADAETEEVATVKAVDDVAAKLYTYKLKMAADTPNEYQGATINIDVVLEGMQYRNTGASDWQLMTTKSVTGVLTGINQPTVPNKAE